VIWLRSSKGARNLYARPLSSSSNGVILRLSNYFAWSDPIPPGTPRPDGRLAGIRMAYLRRWALLPKAAVGTRRGAGFERILRLAALAFPMAQDAVNPLERIERKQGGAGARVRRCFQGQAAILEFLQCVHGQGGAGDIAGLRVQGGQGGGLTPLSGFLSPNQSGAEAPHSKALRALIRARKLSEGSWRNSQISRATPGPSSSRTTAPEKQGPTCTSRWRRRCTGKKHSGRPSPR